MRRACQQRPEQLPLPPGRWRPLLACPVAPGTLLHLTANSKRTTNKAKGLFLGPLRASATRVGHSGSVGGAAEPVCIPPGAGKAPACAGEPRNGALPQPLPPRAGTSGRVFPALSHERCSGHPLSKPEGPESCVSTAGAGRRGHGQTGLRSPPGHATGQGASAAAAGHPSSREGT